MKRCWLAGIVVASAAWAARGADIQVINPGFESGLDGWSLTPGDPSMVRIESLGEDRGQAVKLTADGANLGINSAPLVLGEAIARDQVYRVSLRLRFEGLEKGVAAFSLCAYNAEGRRIAQYAIERWNTESSPHGWVTRSALVGPGTDKPFLSAANTLRLRVSFYDREGDPKGVLWADDAAIVAEEPPLATAGWPETIEVTCKDLGIRFESRSFWTLYRIDYKGDRLCKDQFGSHYGTVANVAGTGFIGSGHTENGETEKIDALTLEIDGRTIDQPERSYEAQTVTLHKRSRIRGIQLDTTITCTNNRILEAVSMKAFEPTDLNLIYHFMHPWVTEMTHYAAEALDGERLQGEFQDDKGMRIAVPVRWSAVYSGGLAKGAVTVVLQAPAQIPYNVRYWDVPRRYRKHYFMTFAGMTVPTESTYEYRVLTIPFESSETDWADHARDIAGDILARQ